MFRLEERQLHILTGLLAVASILLFLVFGISKMPEYRENGNVKGMDDFSEAWVCTYQTEDVDKLKANKSGEKLSDEKEVSMITEIANLPSEFPVKKGETLTLSHKVPDIDMETVYLVMQTKGQIVRAYIGQEVLYESTKSDISLQAFHGIAIPREYKNMVLTIELTGIKSKRTKVSAIYSGTYNEMLIQAFMENGFLCITGLFLISTSICMLVVLILIKNTARQKKLLLYGSLEGLLIGLLFLAESRIAQIFINWNYGIYFAKVCLLVIMAVFHLMIIRLFIFKKKLLFVTDIGILAYGIFYISVMVLQAFSLLHFDIIYFAGKLMFVISIVLYMVILLAAMSGHDQKDGKTVFAANIMLLLSLLMPMLMWVFGRQAGTGNIYICIGFAVYLVLIWIYGIKRALLIRQKKEELTYSEADIRAQAAREMNPNLLFASFKTLQNLIKNDSTNSVKMIYYISTYLRGNLKVLEKEEEVVPFEEELEHIIAYLQLQKTRNQKLSFTMECKVKDFVVPYHSIEPMVENAVKYGIAGNDNKGNVVIRTYERKDGYAIQIIDDGIGFETAALKKKSSTALLNLFDRLQKVCSAKTEVISKAGKGTVITLILPMLENDLLKKD